MNTIFSSARSVQKVLATIAVFAMVFSPLANIQFASADHDTDGPYEGEILGKDKDGGTIEKIRICHATASEDNPYTNPEVNISSFFSSGHDQDNEDIIPPFHYIEDEEEGVMSFPGTNWDSEGQEIWGNNCVAPSDEEPETGSITIYKVVNDESGNSVVFDFSVDASDDDFDGDFDLNGGQNNSRDDILPGTYTFVEGGEEGWILDDISCEAEGNSTFDYEVEDGVEIDFAEGDDVKCTFYNNVDEQPELCEDDSALNYNEPVPCEYPEPVEPLVLTSICTYPDNGGAQWRVRNANNDFDVDFTWEIYNNQETGGPITATHGPAFGAGDTFFDSSLTGTMKIYWYDENNVQKSATKATNPALCEPGPEEFTVDAYKIVCTDESEIPNQSDWAALEPITANTAQAWVDAHDSCEFAEGWQFEWVLDSETTDPGDTLVGPAGGDWTTFGPTDVNGKTSVTLTEDDLGNDTKIWLREVLKDGYLPFTHGQNGNTNVDDYTAAFFCNNDVLNYDNYEWIENIQFDETYNCVAWNYLEPVLGCTDPEALNYNPEATPGNEDAEDCRYPDPEDPVCDYGFGPGNLLDNGSFEEDEVTNASLWQKFASVVGWAIEKVSNGDPTTLELHRGWSGNEAAHEDQYAELDGDQPVRISQDVVTEEGAKYELKWAFAPRQNTAAEENELSIQVDGSEVDTEGPMAGIGVLSQGDWVRGSYEFTAGSDLTEIAFEDLGPESGSGPDVGTFVDDLVLCKIADPEPEDPWCTFEGVVVAYTADEDADQNDGDPVASDRRNISAVETIAPYANFGGKEENDWDVNPLDFFSLGIGGTVTYEFTGDVAYDQAGPDIAIYEITGGNAGTQTNEKVEVEVSEDGINWVSLGDFVGDAAIDIAPAGLNFVKFVRLTDKSQGVQGNNGDGYDLDGIVILHGSCGEEPDPEPKECTVTIVSDETATVVQKGGANAKLLTFIHDAWDAVISGASWIWGDNPVVDPTNEETQTFENKFGWAGTVDSATLYVASDNGHSATINGGTAFAGGSSFASAVSYDVSGEIAQGNNDLQVVVTNTGVPNSTYESNPAGVMYKLVITTTDDVECDVPYEEEPEDDREIITMCKFDWDNDDQPIAGWGMTLTNNDGITYDLETGNDGCVSQAVDPDQGPWEVIEEERGDWEFVEADAENGKVLEGEGADYCEFFGLEDEQNYLFAVIDQEQEEPEYRCLFWNSEDEDDGGGGGGGGGSSRPICREFDLDGDVLSWETSKGLDLEITYNGDTIFSTSDDDVVDEGTYELEDDELLGPGDEYELTVFRGSKEDTCRIELDEDGEVLGAQTEILPLGAPDTGAGGTALPSLPALFAVLGTALVLRKKNV